MIPVSEPPINSKYECVEHQQICQLCLIERNSNIRFSVLSERDTGIGC